MIVQGEKYGDNQGYYNSSWGEQYVQQISWVSIPKMSKACYLNYKCKHHGVTERKKNTLNVYQFHYKS